MFDVCTTGDNTAHIDTIFKFLAHTHRYSSLLQWSTHLGHWGQVAMVGWILWTKCTLHNNHRLNSCDIPTHITTSPPERSFSHYIHSFRLAEEMWTTMKSNLLGKIFLSCSFYLYRFRKYVFYGFPIINFCNPRVHYETPCIMTRLRVGVLGATQLYVELITGGTFAGGRAAKARHWLRVTI